jgi:single-strand DNA-binding protein
MIKVIAIGRLGKDGEIKETINGNMVYSNSIAVSEKYKTKTGETKEKTTWINFVIWQKGAEIFNQYTQKGSQVYLEGKWVNDEYEKDGQKRVISKLEVKDFRFLDAKGGAEKASSDSVFANDSLGF